MQNPVDLTTRATRKTTRFSVRDAKYNAAGAMHRVAWALQNSKATGQECEKPWGNQGFAAERTGIELFDGFPTFLKQFERYVKRFTQPLFGRHCAGSDECNLTQK
jgi:hypothetical protein